MSVFGYAPLCQVCMRKEKFVAAIAGFRVGLCEQHAEEIKPYLNAPERIAELERENTRLREAIEFVRDHPRELTHAWGQAILDGAYAK